MRNARNLLLNALICVAVLDLRHTASAQTNETPSADYAVAVAPSRFEASRGESMFLKDTGDPDGQQYITLELQQTAPPLWAPTIGLMDHMKCVDGSLAVGVLLHTGHGAAAGAVQVEAFTSPGYPYDDGAVMGWAHARMRHYAQSGDQWDIDGGDWELRLGSAGIGYWNIMMSRRAIQNRAHGLAQNKPLVYIATCWGDQMIAAYQGQGARVALGNINTCTQTENRRRVATFFMSLNGLQGQAKRVVSEARAPLDLNKEGEDETTLAPSVLTLDVPCPLKMGDKVKYYLDTKCDVAETPIIDGILCTIENEKWLDATTVEGECTKPPPPGTRIFGLKLRWHRIASANNGAQLDGNSKPMGKPNAHGPAWDDYKYFMDCWWFWRFNGLWDEDATGANGYSHLQFPRRSILDDFELERDGSMAGFSTQIIWDSGQIGLGQGINLRVYGDAEGQPNFDNLIGELKTANYQEQPTGDVAYGRPIVEASVELEPFELPAGVYWLDMQVLGPENVFQLTSGSFADGTGLLSECWADYEDLGRMPGSQMFGYAMDVNFQIIPIGDEWYPPVIIAQPMDQTACPGEPAVFSVQAGGSPPISYQWRKGGIDIPDATDETFTIDVVQPEDAGGYDVVVTNDYDAEISTVGTLTVECPCEGPDILSDPVDQFVCEGAAAAFSVVAEGDQPLSYQWLKYFEPIPGATGDSYTVDPVGEGDFGVFQVEISNGCDTIRSEIASLVVIAPPVISEHPQSQAVCAGGSVILTVTAESAAPLSFQWRRFDPDTNEWVDIPGATEDWYAIDPVLSEDAGDYDVLVSNDCSASVSDPATLTVGLPEPLDNGVIRASFTDYGTSGVRFAQPPVPGDIAWLDVSGGSQVYSWEGNLHYDGGGGPVNHFLADSDEFTVLLPACRYDDVVLSASHNIEFTVRATHWLDGATLTTQLEITNTLAGDLTNVNFAWMLDADLVLPADYEKQPCCPDLPWLGYGSGTWNGPIGAGVQNNLNPCAGVRPANMAVAHTARMNDTAVPDEWTVSNPVGFQGATCAFDGEAQAEPRFLFETPFDNTQGTVGYDQDLGIVTNFRIDTWEAGATHTFTYTLTFRSPDTGQGGTDGTPVEPVEIRRIPPP